MPQAEEFEYLKDSCLDLKEEDRDNSKPIF